MQGDALAQRTLGLVFEGKGVLEAKLPKRLDHKRLAYKWLTLAQRGGVQGLDPALNVLRKELQASDINNALAEASQFVAVVLYDPNNTGQTATQTDLKNHIKNAAAGQAQAQLDLARLCAEGDFGVEQNPVEAYKWFTLAFNQGLEEALTERSKLIKANGMGLDDIIAAKTRAGFQTQQVMNLAGLATGILLAAGQVLAADLNATLKKAEAGDAYQPISTRRTLRRGRRRGSRLRGSPEVGPSSWIKATQRPNIEWRLFYSWVSPERHASQRPCSSSEIS